MHLEEFIDKHNLTLSAPIMVLCREGLHRMENSVDPHHGIEHVWGLLSELDHLLENETLDIQFEVLLPAICWHDVWKSTKRQATNLFVFIQHEFNDGRGSAKLFKRFAKDRIPKHLLKEIAYAIKTHARSKLPFERTVKTVEAKVLRDIDNLDGWHIRRFEHLKKNYLKEGEFIDYKLIRIAIWWYEHVIKKTDENMFYFDYSQKTFIQRKKDILEAFARLWDEREKWVHPKDLKRLEGISL